LAYQALGSLLSPVLALQRRRWLQRWTPSPSLAPTGQQGQATKRLRLLIVGDSMACGHGLELAADMLAPQLSERLGRLLSEAMQRPVAVSWQQFCRLGLTTQAAVIWLSSARLQPADVLVTLLGFDDALLTTPPRAWLTALDSLRNQARHRAGVRYTVHCAPPRMGLFKDLPQPLRRLAAGSAERYDEALRQRLRESERRGRCVLPQPNHGATANAPSPATSGSILPVGGYGPWAEALARHIEFDLSEAQLPRATLPTGFMPSGFYTDDEVLRKLAGALPTRPLSTSPVQRRGSLQRFRSPE
jgi:hypothetical protein